MPKLFVLDTSVLLFDHNAILNFEDNDIVLPITVLEELDKFKIGNETRNFEAREIIRFLDRVSDGHEINQWIDLGKARGQLKIALSQDSEEINAETIYGVGKNDHKIINVALSMRKNYQKGDVILVTKDINLRIKAKALGLNAEDYQTGKVKDIKKMSESYVTLNDLDAAVIHEIYQRKNIPEEGLLKDLKVANGYYVLNNCTQSVLVRYDGQSDSIRHVEKSYAYGIKPKNAEQTFAMDALLNDDIKLVAIEGVAGTGKTLLALAAALEQKNRYDQIILSRPIVPLGNRDIGFLPGQAEEKISPYMQPLWDNLKFIRSQFRENGKKSRLIEQLQETGDIAITALTFIRGRSLSNVIFIIDEAQNLTPHEIKTIITRAGDGTKVIFTGDINQIDTPYMDEQSNGLTYLIDKFRGQDIFAHIKLEKGERSKLANLANELL